MPARFSVGGACVGPAREGTTRLRPVVPLQGLDQALFHGIRAAANESANEQLCQDFAPHAAPAAIKGQETKA
jgi:hypothetical protein